MVVLTAVGCCLGAVAYAATRPQTDKDRKGLWRPLQPRFTEHPDELTSATAAQFAFRQPPRPPGRARPGGFPLHFECRLDRAGWRGCRSPLTLRRLALGAHRFEVRAVNRQESHGGGAAFSWRVAKSEPPVPAPTPAEPTPPQPPAKGKPFSIEPDLSALGPLYPGAPAQPLPVALTNPNSEPIFVTDLRVAVESDPLGCVSAENFDLTPAGASEATPLAIPAGATLTLPAQGIAAPAIAMRDLPFSQDACQGAELPLLFSGEAHG
jgi:hypothetical protein